MSSDDGKPDMTGWGDEDVEHFLEMKRLGLDTHWWSPTKAIQSKQKKETKRLKLFSIRRHNKGTIAAAVGACAAEDDIDAAPGDAAELLNAAAAVQQLSRSETRSLNRQMRIQTTPLASRMFKPVMPRYVMANLKHLAAATLHDKLLTRPESVSVIGPNCNHPQPELFFNTKIAVQFSAVGAGARAAPQRQRRICVACWNPECHAAAMTGRGACCERCVDCQGCDYCVGRSFMCPICKVEFELRWAYETGSGRSAINRDRGRFEVRRMPPALTKAVQGLSRWTPAPAPNSVVLVAYLGPSFCAACKLGRPCMATGGSTKKCGSTLDFHADRGKGANSQSSTANITINVGDPRTLSMALCNTDGDILGGTRATLTQFNFEEGTAFLLDPRDEEMAYRRTADDQVVHGSYKHGMVTEIGAECISAGFVFRNVVKALEVDVRTNWVIMDRTERQHFEMHVLARGLPNPPSEARCLVDTRANMTREATKLWMQQAPIYVAAIEPLVQRAWRRWGVDVL